MSKIKLSSSTPIVFTDGSAIYQELAKQYITHDKGLFILAPSGAGKTHYVQNQAPDARHWIDGDLLWVVTNADPTDDEWESDFELVQEVNARSDVITYQSKKLGFWIMGSSNRYLKPDAIVLPSWETHISFIKGREHGAYDGGAKQTNLTDVQAHRKWIEQWKAEGVPVFGSMDAAAESLAASLAG